MSRSDAAPTSVERPWRALWVTLVVGYLTLLDVAGGRLGDVVGRRLEGACAGVLTAQNTGLIQQRSSTGSPESVHAGAAEE